MSIAAAKPSATGSISVLALACNVPVALVAYSFGFMNSYFMHDHVSTTDHLTFIGFALIALAVSATFMTGILSQAGGMTVQRAAGTAFAASAVLHMAFIGIALSLIS